MQSANSAYLKEAVFGFAAVSIWAGWSVITRLAVTTGLDAWDIAALRFGVAGLLLSPVLMRRGLARDRLGWLGLAAIIAGLGAPYALAAVGGLHFAPASDQGALNPGCMPLFVALIAAMVLGERFSSARKLGLLLIMAGALIIVVGHAWSTSRTLGDALFLVAAFLSACFTVVMLQAKLDPLHAAALVLTGSLVIYLPLYLAFFGTRLAQLPLADITVQALFQGVVVTIVSLLLYGRAVATGAAMTPDTMFWIASMTKAVTSTAAMQMVEQGKLSLDKPISDVVLELSATQVLEGFDASGAPKLRPPKRPITLRHLLTHTAGFSYDLWNKDIERYMKVANIPGVGTCKLEALKTPLIADPGDKWEYGINIDWAGKAVERVSGLSLDGYMRERIFTPLGMKDTVFILKPDQQARMASVHARGAEGKLSPIEFSMPQAPEFFMGGGGLHSTGRDYLTFLRMLLAGGKLNNAQILKPETVALMNRNNMGDVNVTLLKTAQPDLTNDAEFFPGMVKKWGLAYMINTQDVPGGRSAGSLAWAGLANTYFWLDPKKKVTGVILTRILPFADQKTLQLLADFESAVYKNGRAA